MTEETAVRIAEPHELSLQLELERIAVVPAMEDIPKVVIAFSPPLSARAEPYHMRSTTSLGKNTGNSNGHLSHGKSL